MKNVLLTVGMCVLIAFSARGSTAQTAPVNIDIQAPYRVVAGEAWTLTIELGNTTSGTVDIWLLAGLQRHHQSLEIDANGRASWNIIDGEVTASGDMLMIAQHGGQTAQQTMQVKPAYIMEMTVFPIRKTITAYGKDQTAVIALAHDQWGNTITSANTLAASIQHLDPHKNRLEITTRSGLHWFDVVSHGSPGRVTIQLGTEQLELIQTAGPPASINVQIAGCTTRNARDVVSLLAEVHDAAGYPVADGTAVIFEWPNGTGTASVQEGRATLRIPLSADFRVMRAHSGSATSSKIVLTEVCRDVS